jgi:hypothetical protein
MRFLTDQRKRSPLYEPLILLYQRAGRCVFALNISGIFSTVQVEHFYETNKKSGDKCQLVRTKSPHEAIVQNPASPAFPAPKMVLKKN